MFKLVRNIILLNLYVLVQAQGDREGSGLTSGGIPNPSETVSQATNAAGVNRLQILEQASSAKLTPEDLLVNREAFQSISNHFGDIGPLLFDLLTNENALGKEMARASKIITMYLDLERYRHSLASIFDLAENLEFSQRLGPLFASIADVEDRETHETFGQAVEIITNILSDENAIKEIQRRITSPNPVPVAAF